MSAAVTPTGPRIGVVVLTYDNQFGLDRVLAALDRQVDLDGLPLTLDVVVSDDGSPRPPDLRGRDARVALVRQPDEGFRAAAARNAGARPLVEAGCSVLLFLDGDMIPQPSYAARLAAACVAAGERAPGTAHGRGLAVGRRRHADLRAVGLDEVLAACDGAGPGPARAYPAPPWLADGYAATDGLRRADDRSYRYVISAVLATTTALFAAIGGFDAGFIGYGGEDWDLANRAWLAGAEFAYEPAAIAWHDGPDAAGRAADLAVKTAETLRVAAVVTEPGARDPRLYWSLPDIAVDLDDRGWAPETVLLTCADLLAGSDARIWLRDGKIVAGGWWPDADPRVAVGPVPERARRRARYLVTGSAPMTPVDPLGVLCARGPARYPGLVVERVRDRARGVTLPDGDPALVVPVSMSRQLEGVWGGWIPARGTRSD